MNFLFIPAKPPMLLIAYRTHTIAFNLRSVNTSGRIHFHVWPVNMAWDSPPSPLRKLALEKVVTLAELKPPGKEDGLCEIVVTRDATLDRW